MVQHMVGNSVVQLVHLQVVDWVDKWDHEKAVQSVHLSVAETVGQ
jgi:hypothetical protein